ncbi:MAG TPA: hypothetical protein VNI01_10980 [Elusimicrobiota bacterium]|jgi:hypothetical protein|nr:hypothetical protein [Elusimicrobiota bacterium]
MANRSGSAADIVLLACAIGAAALFFWKRGQPLPSRAGPPPTERLQLVDDIGPLRARWLALDVRVSGAEANPAAADWPAILGDSVTLLGDAARVQRRFGQDMRGLVAGTDAATGLSREELVERALGGMDELGSCILGLSERARTLHRVTERRDAARLKESRAALVRYRKFRPACLRSAGAAS